MKLKEFMDGAFKQSPMNALQTARDLVELEMIERKLNLMWGVELEIKVIPTKVEEGRFYGKGVIEAIKK